MFLTYNGVKLKRKNKFQQVKKHKILLNYRLYICPVLTPIQLTPAAVDELKRLQALLKLPEDYVVRISVKKTTADGSCPFVIGFDAVDKNDLSLQMNGLNIHYHKLQGMQLAGTTIDFDTQEKGFIFRQ